MKAGLFVSFALVALTATSVAAQGTGIDTQRCPPGTVNGLGIPDQDRASQDACQKALDVFKYIAPQLGIAITGGNATLGQTGNLGGLGHFRLDSESISLRGAFPRLRT